MLDDQSQLVYLDALSSLFVLSAPIALALLRSEVESQLADFSRLPQLTSYGIGLVTTDLYGQKKTLIKITYFTIT